MTDMVFGATPAKPGEAIIPEWWRTVDRWSLAAIIALFLIGLLLCLAASPPLAVRNGLDPFYYFWRQLGFGIVALLTLVTVSMASPLRLRRWGVVAFLISFVALALLPFLGTDFGKGAIRWYSLRVISVQPAEFLKPSFAICAAWLMAASYDLKGPPGKGLSFAIAVTLTAMLALQPDFGQAGLIIASWALMYFAAGAPVGLLSGIGAGVIGVGWFAYHHSEHVARRINGFLSEEIDPLTQIGYATSAIQEGGIFGVGVGNGSVKWTLPDAHTDFIIAVAAEEYGLILCVVIMALYATVVARSLMRLVGERDPFIRLAGTGLACQFGMQAMINMGVAVRLLPAKGMTLPLISYGGSSLIAACLGLGALLAMTRARPRPDEMEDILGPVH
ncbi:peptidoglycan glycosyltransferase FtsW [Amaricoccus solimangrovi]|uniref:Probable peptidoglycan glycosyltransferase FtsW n=1 Tax=Amaricoccus solimangrovi TaxID=2589815 RepID=A0A501WPX4_9RHOB|nr:putative peptidoglycan glycosyltransferase FtsW [Amaricoccus solimangrovi]TPE50164.1 cell division protein FtsW [Amaricoccus solimangrovi]